MGIDADLAANGIPYPVARELIAAINGTPTTALRLQALGVQGRLAVELAAQINGGTKNVNALMALGFPSGAAIVIGGSSGGPPALPTPVLLEAFDSLTGFTTSGAATYTVDTTVKVQGVGSIRMEGNDTSATFTLTKSLGTIDLPADDIIAWYVNQEETNIDTNASYVSFDRGGVQHYSSPTVSYNDQYGAGGGFWEVKPISEFLANGSGAALPTGSALTGIRHRSDMKTGSCRNAVARQDAVYRNAKGRPTLVIQLHDGYASQVANMIPRMDAAGLKASIMLPWGNVGNGSRMTEAQVLAMNASGHAICLDGTADDSPIMGTQASPRTYADWLTMMQTGNAWLSSRGLTRGMGHITFPSAYKAGDYALGGANPTVKALINHTVTLNGDNTGTATVAPVAGIVGCGVRGFGVPRGTTVTAVSGTTITFDRVLSAQTGRNLTFFDVTGDWRVGRSRDGLASIGFKSASTGVRGQSQLWSSMYTRFGIPQPFDLWALSMTNFTDYASQLKPHMDRIRQTGETLQVLVHEVFPGATGINSDTSFIDAWFADIAPDIAAGTMVNLTLPAFYDRDSVATPPAA